jgi:hypothetical protein
MFVPRYDEQTARAAVETSLSYSEALRKLGLRPAGGNHKLFRRYVDEVWKIPTSHFDQARVRTQSLRQRVAIPLVEVLVEGSSYSRHSLKARLYEAGLKYRRCEVCGQGELWRGESMSLILDHINGVPDDNRLENLRILCPNCNATLDTHCGRKNVTTPRTRNCELCGREFAPKYRGHAYCSSACGSRHANRHRKPRPESRKVERPSYEQLLKELSEMSVLAVGRKYGVSDNAVRKWLRWYEAQAARAEVDAEVEAEQDLAA